MFSTSRDVQYIGGCSVHWAMFSTSRVFSTKGDIMSTLRGYNEFIGDVQYIGGIKWVHWEISWVHRGMFSTLERYHEYIGGYHEYIGGCSVHRRDIMIHVREQLDKILSISTENSKVLNIPRCTDHQPMYSWYPSNVLMISPDVLMVSLRYTEHPLIYPWYPSDVLNTPPPPNVLMVSPQCTHGNPRCAEHPLMYWTSPDVLDTHYTGWTHLEPPKMYIKFEKIYSNFSLLLRKSS